jgi:hypothetical protein
MELLEWIVWVMMLLVTIGFSIAWADKTNSLKEGKSCDGIELILILGTPKLIIVWGIILISFLFINVNKLHLLWLFLVSFFVNTYYTHRKCKFPK